MTILITGSDGQLGSELQQQLRDKKNSIGKIPESLMDASVTAVDVKDLDITDEKAVSSFVKDGEFDVIINCAAFTNVDRSETDPDTAFRVNADAPGYLAKAANRYGARLIHVSTDYVFSGDAASPRKESDETIPNTVYGKSKLEGERRVFENTKNAAVVRTAWLYGLIGNNIVKTLLKAARENGAVKVVNDQFGNPTSAVDLAHHILKLAASNDTGIFHCTNHGICSWYDFAKKFIEDAGIDATVTPCTTAEYPRPAPRPAYSALLNVRLKETVGDEMRDWQEAIEDYIRVLAKTER